MQEKICNFFWDKFMCEDMKKRNLIYVTDVENFFDSETISASLSVLPPKRRCEAEKISAGISFLHSLAAGVLLSMRLGEIGIDATELDYKRDTRGKPFFPLLRNFHFSISHSGIYVAVAFSDDKVGFDIERIRPDFPDAAKLSERFFSAAEAEYVSAGSKNIEVENEKFFRIWCLKESAVKFSGNGLSDIRKYECFDAVKGEKKKYIESDEGMRGFFSEFSFDSYRAAVCAASSDDFHIRFVDFSEIKEFILH